MSDNIDQIKVSLNKKFKGNMFKVVESNQFYRIPFSSSRLNYLTRGGLPYPGASELSGPEGAGKTTLEIDLIKHAQALGLTCAVIDTENKFDMEYAEWLGVKKDDLIFTQPTGLDGETVLELALGLIEEGAKFCAIDSIPSLVPKSVYEGDMSDKQYCGSSGILSTFSQKVSGTGILQEKGACLLGINQVRDKVGGYGLQTPGGHFWRHICICRLQLAKGNPFDHNYKDLPYSTTEETAGYSMELRMLKNQFSKNDRRFAKCTFTYDIGIDELQDLIDVAIEIGVIYKSGAWYRFVDPTTGEVISNESGDIKLQGKANVRNFLKEEDNSQIYKWVKLQVDQKLAE